MKRYLAEFIGTFALVFFGTGAVIVDQQTGGSLGLLGISATFGIIVTAVIYIFGNISGAHINPAVTIGLAIGKLMPKKDVLGYVVAQTCGAVLASSTLVLLFPENQSLGATLPSGSILQSLIIELILTYFLLLTILGITSNKATLSLAGIVIGVMITGMILFSGPISGGSFNPARSFAPALLSGNFSALWIYILAPTAGAILAMLTWKAINKTAVEE